MLVDLLDVKGAVRSIRVPDLEVDSVRRAFTKVVLERHLIRGGVVGARCRSRSGSAGIMAAGEVQAFVSGGVGAPCDIRRNRANWCHWTWCGSLPRFRRSLGTWTTAESWFEFCTCFFCKRFSWRFRWSHRRCQQDVGVSQRPLVNPTLGGSLQARKALPWQNHVYHPL